jgi:hypothetical protein
MNKRKIETRRKTQNKIGNIEASPKFRIYEYRGSWGFMYQPPVL